MAAIKKSRQTAFRYPVTTSSSERAGSSAQPPLVDDLCQGPCPRWSRPSPEKLDIETSTSSSKRARDLKAVWQVIFGLVFPGIFGRSRPPGLPPDRRGPPRTSISTKNQPRRRILRPNGGDQKIPPDCLQVPRKEKPYTRSGNWVPEGSLPGVFVCHEMALELVSGADFWCKLMSLGSPGDLGWSRGRSPA